MSLLFCILRDVSRFTGTDSRVAALVRIEFGSRTVSREKAEKLVHKEYQAFTCPMNGISLPLKAAAHC